MKAKDAFKNLDQFKDSDKAKLAKQLDFILSFKKTNFASHMAFEGDLVRTKYALKINPDMHLLKQEKLLFSEGFIKVLEKENNLVDRVDLEDKDKLRAIFNYYQDKEKLKKLIPALSESSIKTLYV